MIERVNLIRCKCDICKESKNIEVGTPGEEYPVKLLKLPMRLYGEKGERIGYTVGRVHACDECIKELWEHLDERYSLDDIEWVGVRIERKEK